MCMHPQTHTHSHTPMHACMHTCPHALTHTYTHLLKAGLEILEALGVRDREKVNLELWFEGRQNLSMLHRETDCYCDHLSLVEGIVASNIKLREQTHTAWYNTLQYKQSLLSPWVEEIGMYVNWCIHHCTQWLHLLHRGRTQHSCTKRQTAPTCSPGPHLQLVYRPKCKLLIPWRNCPSIIKHTADVAIIIKVFKKYKILSYDPYWRNCHSWTKHSSEIVLVELRLLEKLP